MLAIKDLSFAYDDENPVLRDIALFVGKGELVSLLGPSGCGKSTILRLVAGLLEADRGSITWSRDEKPEIGFVFQDAALMPWQTVAGNIALPLTLRGHPLGPDLLASLLQAVGLEGLGGRYPGTLSGGQKMRVSIARALAAKSDFLLLDEPFGALDEILRFKMNELVLGLKAEQQWSALFVTHSIYEAVYMSDRVLVMKEGAISGAVSPELDRTLSPSDQRSSPAFAEAVRQVSELLEMGAPVYA